MATQPTNLPVPSESPRDLKFNAGKIDEFVTSDNHEYIDRFGNKHRTIAGINNEVDSAIIEIGWKLIDSFQDGATITDQNQALRWRLPDGDGEYYRWGGDFPKVVPAGSTPETTGGVGSGGWIGIGDAALRPQSNANDYNLWRNLSNLSGIVIKGTFESGFTLDDKTQAGLYLKDGLIYTRINSDNVTVPAGSYPDPDLWEPAYFIKEETIHVGIEPFKISENNTAEKNDSILEKLARYIETKTGPVRVVFPKGIFQVGSQVLSGATGMGGSYIPNQKCTVRNFIYPLRYEFNDTKFEFADGLRVGSFDPVTGTPVPSIQTDFDYRANRGILFGFNNCPLISVSGRVDVDFNGANVVLGGEFGDGGYQCPEYGFWFIDHKVLIFDAHYTASDGAMDALYLAGLNGVDCYSRVVNFSFDKMGRSALVIAGGDNIYISGKATRSGLGSISSSPGHNFAIESEARRVSNVTFESIMSIDAKSSAFSIYNPNIGLVKDVRLIGSSLTNSSGIVCKSNTPNVKYIGCSFRGVLGEHRNEFFDSANDARAVELIDCDLYDSNVDGTTTPSINGTIFDSTKTIRLTFTNCNIVCSGLSSGRGTIGALYEPVFRNTTLSFNGDITYVATNGIRVFYIQNPKSMDGFEIINRTTGSGGSNTRAYIGISNISSSVVSKTRISGTGQPKDTILWMQPLISDGGRAGALISQRPSTDVISDKFIALGVNAHLQQAQSISGYQRIFSVSALPSSGDWVMGDVLFFNSPSPGGSAGWICTTSGTAGSTAVFKTFGSIAS